MSEAELNGGLEAVEQVFAQDAADIKHEGGMKSSDAYAIARPVAKLAGRNFAIALKNEVPGEIDDELLARVAENYINTPDEED